jgi:glycerophosphoryl diester phosphodiesterase
VTLVVAHRGASAVAPENTLEAFEKAIELGADMVELDVRRGADGGLAISHDPLPAPDVPTLEQVVALCAGRIALDVELKEPGLAEDVLRVVSGVEVVVTSFLAEVVERTKQLRPDVRVGLLLNRDAQPPHDVIADFLAPHYELLERIPGNGLVVWTVNDEATLERLFADPRVAGVVTDDLELALAVRSAGSSSAARDPGPAPASSSRRPRRGPHR